jgi:hypothetical protein
MIFHCVYFLKLDGFKANDNCTYSRNGPILMVDERVMIKIAQIDEYRKNEARITKKLSSIQFDIDSTAMNALLESRSNYLTPNIINNKSGSTTTTTLTTSLTLNRDLANLKSSQRVKSKKSLFPIYF